jgi:hypothetical protein
LLVLICSFLASLSCRSACISDRSLCWYLASSCKRGEQGRDKESENEDRRSRRESGAESMASAYSFAEGLLRLQLLQQLATRAIPGASWMRLAGVGSGGDAGKATRTCQPGPRCACSPVHCWRLRAPRAKGQGRQKKPFEGRIASSKQQTHQSFGVLLHVSCASTNQQQSQ